MITYIKMDFEETSIQLTRSLIGTIVPTDEVACLDRWRLWMRLYPEHTASDMHANMINMKKYHHRAAHESNVLIECLDDDSPLRSTIEKVRLLSLAELRLVELKMMCWEMEAGNIVLMDARDGTGVYYMATLCHNLHQWICDEIWEMCKTTKDKRNCKGMRQLAGTRPFVNDSMTTNLKYIRKSLVFLAGFAGGDTLSCLSEDVGTNTFTRGPRFVENLIKRVGMIVQQFDRIFRQVEDKVKTVKQKRHRCRGHFSTFRFPAEHIESEISLTTTEEDTTTTSSSEEDSGNDGRRVDIFNDGIPDGESGESWEHHGSIPGTQD